MLVRGKQYRTPRIQVARDYAATWTQKNPLLLAGEFGLELDTGKLKIGDGKTRWSDLPYINP
jgi:hypothetical protein